MNIKIQGSLNFIFKSKIRYQFILLSCFIFFPAYSEVFQFPRRWEIPVFNGRDITFMNDSSSRKDAYPMLHIETYRAFADVVLDQANPVLDTEDLFDGCVLYIENRFLHDFYFSALPKINNKIIVIAHGTGMFHYAREHRLPFCTWDNYHRSKSYYLTPKFSSHPNIIAFFAKNVLTKHPHVHGLPLGINFLIEDGPEILDSVVTRFSPKAYFEEKKIDVYQNYKLDMHVRRPLIYKHWKSQPGVVSVVEKKSFEEYFNDMQNSKFVISPRGYGMDCFRTWEALYAGAIPVLEETGVEYLYEELPVIIVEDLTKITRSDLEKEYEKLKSKTFNFDRLFADFWLKKVKFYKETYEKNNTK